MSNTTILIVDDHTILREGLALLFTKHPHLDVVGEAANGKEAISRCKELVPDIVLMDLDMPILNGIEATRIISKDFPNTKVIVLSMHPDHEYVQAALKAGAKGFLVKETAAGEMIQAIMAVSDGKAFFSPSVSSTIIDKMYAGDTQKGDIELLTRREREILQLIAEGNTTKHIAELLYISHTTVSKHRENIMRKLGLHDTAGLVRYAIQKGIISNNKPKYI
ncbi:MAG: response regulator transcription factor [Candidatus Neomarinimicrobiota bacterium]